MEEIRSTEKLEKEILDDAAKKAAKIKRAADEQIASMREESARRIEAEIAAEKARLDAKIIERTNESAAAMTLGRRRIYLEYINKQVEDALAAFLSSLSREEKSSIVEREITKRLFALDKARAQRNNIDENTVVLDDGAVRITASVDEAARDFLLEKRAELPAALMGGDNHE